MTSITKDMTIGDILDADRETIPFFLEMGMHCLGCPASRGESVEEACAVHGVDADELVKKINDFLASKSSKYRRRRGWLSVLLCQPSFF